MSAGGSRTTSFVRRSTMSSLSARSRAASTSSTCRRSIRGRSSTLAASLASRSTCIGATAGSTAMLHEEFFYDGMWHEAPSYHYQVVGGINGVIDRLRGYSDPPGYKNPVDGLHFENFDARQSLPFVEKAAAGTVGHCVSERAGCPGS